MSGRSKLRDSVVATLNDDFCQDLEKLLERNASNALFRDKVSMVRKKIAIIAKAVKAGLVAPRLLTELMELCEIFAFNDDGIIEATVDYDNDIDLLKQVSSKVSAAFEIICFNDWSLQPVDIHQGHNDTPSPLENIQEKPTVESNVPFAMNGEPLQPQPPYVMDSAPEPAISKFVKSTSQQKKPVVLFNPMAQRAAKVKEEAVLSPKSDESSPFKSPPQSLPGGSLPNSAPGSASHSKVECLAEDLLSKALQFTSLTESPSATVQVPAVSSSASTTSMPPRLGSTSSQSQPNSGRSQFSLPTVNSPEFVPSSAMPGTSQPVIPHRAQFVLPTPSASEFLPSSAQQPQLITAATPQLLAAAANQPQLIRTNTLPQPPFGLPNLLPTTQILPNNPTVAPPTLFNIGSVPQYQVTGQSFFTGQSLLPNANTVPRPQPQVEPQPEQTQPRQRKAIRIFDPTTGQEVDVKKMPEESHGELSAKEGQKENEVANEKSTMPPGFGMSMKKAPSGPVVESDEECFGAQERPQTSLMEPHMESSVSSRPHSACASVSKAGPPGFEAQRNMMKLQQISEESKKVVSFTIRFLREKSKSSKPMKTERVFIAYQDEAFSSVLDINEFTEILKGNNATFRFSATNSKIELVEVIEVKIVNFIVAELVRQAEHRMPGRELYDTYVSVMRDARRVIHVGAKFSFTDFCELFPKHAEDVVSTSSEMWLLEDSFLQSVISIALVEASAGEVLTVDMFKRFQEAASERLRSFVTCEVFLDLLSQRADLFRIANLRVSLAQQPVVKKWSQSGTLDKVDDYGESERKNSAVDGESMATQDLDVAMAVVCSDDDGNFDAVSAFVDDFNEVAIDAKGIIPVRILPEPKADSSRIGYFRGHVASVSMEARRVFVEFRTEPVSGCFSSANDLKMDDDFLTYANALIFTSARSCPVGWCDVGQIVLYYGESNDSYGRGVVLDFFAVPHCGVDINVPVVESITVMDIDTGEVHEKISATHASSLTKFREIPCLVARCAFSLEPGAAPPRTRRTIKFTLDTRSLFPAPNEKAKKVKAARESRLKDYRSGVLPIPIVVLA